jgi:murein DD-endopeptidase MepM/ murein hydrolase activator NlpD
MRHPRGHVVVAALLAVQVAGLGVGFVAEGGHRADAAQLPLRPSPVAATSTTTPSGSPSPQVTPTASATVAPPVAALKGRIAPDVLVETKAPMTAAQAHGLLSAVKAGTALLVDAGPVRLDGGTTTALGVDPSSFRAWTPAGTAESTPLWQTVAAGKVAVAQAVATALAVPLGGEATVGAAAPVTERVGAFATTGLPGVGVVVDGADDGPLHLVRSAGLLLVAPGQDPIVTAALATRYLTDHKEAGTATAVRVPVTNGHLQWVAPAYGPITSPYGPREDPNHPGQTEFHAGVDIGAPLGAPIYAASNGVVEYAGPASGFGQEVVLTHADGVTTVYGHMETILVTSGPVTAGEPIALVGAEGDATGPHLHFEVHVNNQTVDPVAWLIAHGVKIDS